MVPLGLAAIWAGGDVWLAVLALLGAGVAIEWLRLSRRNRAVAVAGLLYVGLACFSLAQLRQAPHGFANVIFVMLVVWAGDIGAYIAGRWIGGPRMAPSLSPGKTWSGAAGGLFCSTLAGLGVALAVSSPGHAAFAAAALAVVAQAGDLLESGLKRWSGAKDSGGLIPGHGGLLDRLDGLLAAAPVGFILWRAAGQGAFLWQ